MQALIFDLDDTLVDSAEVHKAAFELALNHCGHSMQELPLGTWMNCYGRRIPDIVDIFYDHFKDITVPKAEYLRIRDESFLKNAAIHLPTMPGFAQLTEYVRTHRHVWQHTALASSGSREYLNLSVRVLKLEGFFDQIISGEDVINGKPAPDIFFKAARALLIEPKLCTVIEDSPHGIAAAKAAGMRCIGVKNLHVSHLLDLSEADVVVENLAQAVTALSAEL